MSEKVIPKIVFKRDSSTTSVKEESPKLIESLPCRIDFTGPAAVDSYFLVEELSEGGVYASTFRGKLLYGHKAVQPTDYKFYVANRQRGLDQQSFQLKDHTGDLRIWDLDLEECVQKNSSVQRSINFLNVAEDLAQSDEEEEN